ncbi:MAG TPA: Ig-like domain-containing protein, partial [Allosphingosinicella sp.]
LVGSVAAINNALDGLSYAGPADSNGARDLTIGVSDNGFTGPNLIFNPGGENGTAAADYATAVKPGGWDRVGGTGGLSVIQYATGGADPTLLNSGDDSAPIGGGNDFFTGGPGGASSAVSQTIDVSGEAARIDGGDMIANMSGFFGGFMAQEDTMTMTVRFLDANGDELDSAELGGPSAADRGNETKLLPYAGAASIPVGTRTIEVVLSATNSEGDSTDGYADRLSLTLSELVTDTVSIDLAAANDPVGVAAGPDVSVAEEGSVAIGGLSISDVDAVLAPDGEYTVTLSAADGTLTVGTPTGLDFTAGDGTGDATMTFHGTLAEVNAALATVSFTGAEDFVGATDVDISVTDQTGAAVATGSGAATSATDSVGVTVTAVNDAPVIDLDSGAAGSGATLAYTENGPAARIAPDATLTDPDSADYDGGSLEVEFTGNGDGDDRLTISDGGGITVAGGAVSYNGTEIGSVTGGTSGSDPLQISFNSAASVAAVQAVLQQVSYSNVSDTPSVLARTITYTLTDNDGGTETGTAVATVNVAATDDTGTAADDAFATDEATAITGENVLDNDDDIDSTLEVGSVEGVAGNVGNQFALASGALVTLEADGTLSYDANGAFDHLAQTGSGAQNVLATDSFSYTLTDGTSATVTITIDGVASDPHRMIGSSGNDDITGTSGVDWVRIEQGGDDIARGQGGDDVFNLGAGFTAADAIDGGTGYDMLKLSGDYYTVPLVLGSDTLRRVEMILLSGGNSYDLTTHDDTVAAGRTLVVSGAALSPLEELWFDGSAETDGAFRLLGGGCNDFLVGGARNDVLNGGIGTNLLAGGDGDDIYVVVGTGDTIVELAGEGFDAVRASVDYVLGDDLEALLLLDTAVLGVGNALDNLVIGNGGDNKLRGGDGHDMLAGDGGADNLQGNAGDDSLFGGAGADALFGSSGKDRLSGNNGADTLDAGTGDDRLYGGDANDILLAGIGNDTLFGGVQRDTLTGGAGRDTFAFADSDSSALLAQADRITDFSAAQHDVIHLRQIDANENTVADDKFSFIGTGAFSGAAGELRYQVVGGDALLQGDTDGNGIADFFIRVEGVTVLTSGDILG